MDGVRRVCLWDKKTSASSSEHGEEGIECKQKTKTYLISNNQKNPMQYFKTFIGPLGCHEGGSIKGTINMVFTYMYVTFLIEQE